MVKALRMRANECGTQSSLLWSGSQEDNLEMMIIAHADMPVGLHSIVIASKAWPSCVWAGRSRAGIAKPQIFLGWSEKISRAYVILREHFGLAQCKLRERGIQRPFAIAQGDMGE